MIEKRFSQKDEDDWEIFENGEHFAYAHSGYNAKKIIERLNELYDRLDCHILLTDQERQKVSNFIKGIEKENEQLKQFKEDVFNKIDMHLRMLPTARDNVNGEYGDPSLYLGAIYMLETLKKELQE